MIGLGLLRGVFLGGIMMWYSLSVWKTVDQYFRDQFQEYLVKEYQENDAMRQDVLVEKEKLAARKVNLEKLKKLEVRDSGKLPPEFSTTDGIGDGIYEGLNGYTNERGSDQVSLGYVDHGGFSAEEVDSGHGPWETGKYVKVPDGFHVEEEGPPNQEDWVDGECLVEDCGGGHGDQVSTRWRNVFDEGDNVCRFDEHGGAEEPCSQVEEVWLDGEEANGNE